MPQVLLTGANGFVGSHILKCLLENGYSVTAAVRSDAKAKLIKKLYADLPPSCLDFAIIPDICQPSAFSEALQHGPPFDAVIHSASPFRFDVQDIRKELLEPAISGTTNLLRAVEANAPTVKRFILTSSFAAIEDPTKGPWPEHTYTEKDWSPLTFDDGVKNPFFGYLASKALSERAAWDFAFDRKSFTVTSINPPMIFGPMLQAPDYAHQVNTSNQLIWDLLNGKHSEKLPDTGLCYFADSRDVALAHVRALESPGAENKRFIVAAGIYSNKEICDVIRDNFPEYASLLPSKGCSGGSLPHGGVAHIDNSRAIETLNMEYRSIRESITDLVRSLEALNMVRSQASSRREGKAKI